MTAEHQPPVWRTTYGPAETVDVDPFVVTSPHALTDAARTRLHEQLADAIASGKPVVMEDGLVLYRASSPPALVSLEPVTLDAAVDSTVVEAGLPRWVTFGMGFAVALIIVGLLLVARPASAAGDWRPPRPDRLALLDAAMAPTLADLRPTVDAIGADLTLVTARLSWTDPAAAIVAMDERAQVARRLAGRVADLRGLAVSGLSILALHPPEDCWHAYWAVLLVGWLSVGDAAESIAAGANAEVATQLGVGLHLLGPLGDLEHAAAVAGCS